MVDAVITKLIESEVNFEYSDVSINLTNLIR